MTSTTDPNSADPVSRGGRGPAYVVTCLAGHGIGPEVTAAASRALAELSRAHGFRIDEVHPPFDTEAIASSGHPLPAPTRRATQNADAVLVAGAGAPALEGVRAELDLAVTVTRVLEATGETTIFAPLHEDATDAALARAVATARARSGRLCAIGVTDAWRELVDGVATGHDGVSVEHVSLRDGLRWLAAGGLGVVAVELAVADAVVEAPRVAGRPCLIATGEVGRDGRGVFAPTHATGHSDAGHGVVDPSEMLLATALLLSEGLGRRAAGESLEESLAVALARPVRDADGAGAVTATTREFVDAVLGLLPSSRRDTEFALGVTR